MRASVVIAAHNEGESLSKTIGACVESTAQLDHEIIVADDASFDGSIEEAQRRFPRIRTVRHDRRLGTSPAKDLGARQARGEVLVFLDGHTNPEPGAIRRLVEDVEHLKGQAVVTPAVAVLDTQRWRNTPRRSATATSSIWSSSTAGGSPWANRARRKWAPGSSSSRQP